jgi:hypothetical protein
MHGLANARQVSSSSSSKTTSIFPNASGFPASCPTDDRKTIRDNSGVAYQVLCASDVGAQGGGPQTGPSATSSFNDCFALCDDAVLTGGAGRCTRFTYSGQPNGVGGGTCYLKSGTSYTVNSAGNNLIGAIRQAGVVSSSSSSVVLAPTTSSSSALTLASSTSSTASSPASSTSSAAVASSSSVAPSPIQTQTLTYTTISYATVTTTTSYPVTTTVISTSVQTFTTSYPVTTTEVSTAPG